MGIFLSSLNQMLFLMMIIAIGYILARIGVVEYNASKTLSKLENNVFVPALVLGTFMKRFTVQTFKSSWSYLLCGFIVIVVSALLAILISKVFTKDLYDRKVYTYGLAISNFGFMGNAVVLSLFPDLFMNYLVFTVPFNVVMYSWAIPNLLLPSDNGKKGFIGKFKPLMNPMFFALVAGAILGLLNLPIPSFVDSAASVLGSCMSPVAMLLTGITIARMNVSKLFGNVKVYLASVIRLLIIPIAGIIILSAFKIPYSLSLCTVCSLAMPLGLNTIVIPEAYGIDTSLGASMALVSHLMSCITIPIVLLLFEKLA